MEFVDLQLQDPKTKWEDVGQRGKSDYSHSRLCVGWLAVGWTLGSAPRSWGSFVRRRPPALTLVHACMVQMKAKKDVGGDPEGSP